MIKNSAGADYLVAFYVAKHHILWHGRQLTEGREVYTSWFAPDPMSEMIFVLEMGPYYCSFAVA